MEGHSHHSICKIKGFLHPITMMNVNINIEYSWVVPVGNWGYVRDYQMKENGAKVLYLYLNCIQGYTEQCL